MTRQFLLVARIVLVLAFVLFAHREARASAPPALDGAITDASATIAVADDHAASPASPAPVHDGHYDLAFEIIVVLVIGVFALIVFFVLGRSGRGGSTDS